MRLTTFTGSLSFWSKGKKLNIRRSGRNELTQECMSQCVYGASGVVGSEEHHVCVFFALLRRDKNRNQHHLSGFVTTTHSDRDTFVTKKTRQKFGL